MAMIEAKTSVRWTVEQTGMRRGIMEEDACDGAVATLPSGFDPSPETYHSVRFVRMVSSLVACYTPLIGGRSWP